MGSGEFGRKSQAGNDQNRGSWEVKRPSGTSMRVIIRGCLALMANESEDPDSDMMVYDEHLDKWKENDKTPFLPSFPAYIPDLNPTFGSTMI